MHFGFHLGADVVATGSTIKVHNKYMHCVERELKDHIDQLKTILDE